MLRMVQTLQVAITLKPCHQRSCVAWCRPKVLPVKPFKWAPISCRKLPRPSVRLLFILPRYIAFNSPRQSDTPSGVGNLRRRSGVRPTRCRPSRLCELSWYEVSEPAKHLSLSPNLAVVAYLDNAKLDLVVMPPPPRVSWQLVAAHYLVTKEAGHCAPRAHPLPDYLLLHTKLERNKCMAITSLNTMVLLPLVQNKCCT